MAASSAYRKRRACAECGFVCPAECRASLGKAKGENRELERPQCRESEEAKACSDRHFQSHRFVDDGMAGGFLVERTDASLLRSHGKRLRNRNLQSGRGPLPSRRHERSSRQERLLRKRLDQHGLHCDTQPRSTRGEYPQSAGNRSCQVRRDPVRRRPRPDVHLREVGGAAKKVHRVL